MLVLITSEHLDRASSYDLVLGLVRRSAPSPVGEFFYVLSHAIPGHHVTMSHVGMSYTNFLTYCHLLVYHVTSITLTIVASAFPWLHVYIINIQI